MTRLLTADEVAERRGVTKDWVWAQARAGRYRRFREDAIEMWLSELERLTGPPERPKAGAGLAT
jgi:hypothetical protein